MFNVGAWILSFGFNTAACSVLAEGGSSNRENENKFSTGVKNSNIKMLFD